MPKSFVVGATILLTSAFGATGVEAPGHSEFQLTGLDAVAMSDIRTARIESAYGLAHGAIERFHLNDEGEIDALRIRWSRGIFSESFSLTQPAERFSYDPSSRTIRADAEAVRLTEWAAEDARLERTSNGLDIERVSPGRLNGREVRDSSGEVLGRIVAFEYSPHGELERIVFVRRQGFFGAPVRVRVPAHDVRWSVREQYVRLENRTSA